jgi:hypothetical protein
MELVYVKRFGSMLMILRNTYVHFLFHSITGVSLARAHSAGLSSPTATYDACLLKLMSTTELLEVVLLARTMRQALLQGKKKKFKKFFIPLFNI